MPHKYIEQLAREGKSVELLEEKNRVEQIVYETELLLQGALCTHEREKLERQFAEGKELIALIEHVRINIMYLIK